MSLARLGSFLFGSLGSFRLLLIPFRAVQLPLVPAAAS